MSPGALRVPSPPAAAMACCGSGELKRNTHRGHAVGSAPGDTFWWCQRQPTRTRMRSLDLPAAGLPLDLLVRLSVRHRAVARGRSQSRSCSYRVERARGRADQRMRWVRVNGSLADVSSAAERAASGPMQCFFSILVYTIGHRASREARARAARPTTSASDPFTRARLLFFSAAASRAFNPARISLLQAAATSPRLNAAVPGTAHWSPARRRHCQDSHRRSSRSRS